MNPISRASEAFYSFFSLQTSHHQRILRAALGVGTAVSILSMADYLPPAAGYVSAPGSLLILIDLILCSYADNKSKSLSTNPLDKKPNTLQALSLEKDVSQSHETDRKKAYQQANEKNDIDLVRSLNMLGLQSRVPIFSTLTIVSNYMDIATKYNVIFKYLKELSNSNKLISEQQFRSLPEEEWINKRGNFSRILGCDHLQKIIHENRLEYIKVPEKIVVIKKEDPYLTIHGFDYGEENLYSITCEQIEIYAKKIKPVDRKVSRREIDEVFKIIKIANFTDFETNFIIAQDGIYFIDTEFKSFCGHVNWKHPFLFRIFRYYISEQDMEYFEAQIEEYSKSMRPKKDYSYFQIAYGHRGLQEDEIKDRVAQFEYVGLAKIGHSRDKPNIFSFNLRDIMQTSS